MYQYTVHDYCVPMQQDFKDKVKELGSNILNLTDENEVRRNSNLLNKKIHFY